MKINFALYTFHWFVALLLLASSAPAWAEELTLERAYALALHRSETVAIEREQITAAEARFLQALSGALPRASFQLSEKRQDGTGDSSFTLRRTPERKFVFSQPLFSGFKEFAAMAGARAEERQQRQEQARAEQLLLVDVADAYTLLLEHRETLAAFEGARAALMQRLDELGDRERLGRSRPSERVSAEAQLRRVLADWQQAQSDETVARELLEFLIGQPADGPVLGLGDRMPALDAEAAYAARASARPDVAAAREAWQAQKKEVTVARSALWPSVSLESNYYTERVGVAANVDWDALLMVDVPLFQGGQAVGEVREAKSEAHQAQLAYERTARQAALEVRQTYAELASAMQRTDMLAKALAAAEENYRLQTEDYRLSLVNNLDVLQALEQLEQARRDWIAARYDAWRLHYQLKAAVGETL